MFGDYPDQKPRPSGSDSRGYLVDSIDALTLPAALQQPQDRRHGQRAQPCTVDDLTLPARERHHRAMVPVAQRWAWTGGHLLVLLGVLVLLALGGVWVDAQAQIAAGQGDAPRPALAHSTAQPAAPPAPPPTWGPPPAAQTTVVPPYVLPVQPWSVARFGSCHHDYPASDIFAPTGTSVVAVTDGVVDFVSHADHWTPGEDGPATRGVITVAIVGDRDHTRYYYSHLSTVQDQLWPGVHVRAGAVIGTVGTSGNARSTPPHVHFGISQPPPPGDWATRRGTVDPAPLLHTWSQGRMIALDTSAPATGICGAAAAAPSAAAVR